MPEPAHRTPLKAESPLADRSALSGEQVALAERALLGRLTLRAPPHSEQMALAVREIGGQDWPPPANAWRPLDGSRQLVWLGPDEALLLCDGGETAELCECLRAVLGAAAAAVTEVSDGATCIRLSGRAALAVLAKGCPLDLEELPAGSAAQTLLGRLDVLILVQAQGEVYDLHVRSSLAAFAWDWLADAAREFL